MTDRQRRAMMLLFVESGPNAVQLALVANALWWAAMMQDPRTFGTARVYAWMAARGTEHHWSMLCLAVGIVGLLGLVAANRHARALGAFVSSLLTGVIALGFAKSNPDGTGSGTYVILTLLSYWLLWRRLFRDA